MSRHYWFRQPTLFQRILRRCIQVSFWLIGISVAATFLLRFIPPPTSGLMLERLLEARIDIWNDRRTAYSHRYQWKPLKNIAPVMQRAVMTAEDQRFPEHYGFDWQAINKAIQHNQKRKRVRGASTISQQTAKNLFLWSGRNWLRKGLEVYFTSLIEILWPKQRILEVYLNIIEFGDGIYGVEAAAQHYFHKSAAGLTAEEAALLTAVLPNPRSYRVNNPSEYIISRQQWILNNLYKVPSLPQ